jgi:hypothetical protein
MTPDEAFINIHYAELMPLHVIASAGVCWGLQIYECEFQTLALVSRFLWARCQSANNSVAEPCE